MEASLAAAEREDPARLIVDLSRLQFIDSTGLRLLLQADARAKEPGYELVLRPGAQAVQRVFEVTGALAILRFEGSPGRLKASNPDFDRSTVQFIGRRTLAGGMVRRADGHRASQPHHAGARRGVRAGAAGRDARGGARRGGGPLAADAGLAEDRGMAGGDRQAAGLHRDRGAPGLPDLPDRAAVLHRRLRRAAGAGAAHLSRPPRCRAGRSRWWER